MMGFGKRALPTCMHAVHGLKPITLGWGGGPGHRWSRYGGLAKRLFLRLTDDGTHALFWCT